MSFNPTPSDRISIRPATLNDTDVIYDFVCELEGIKLNQTRFREVFERNLTNPMIHYLVAEQAENVIGFVSCHVQYLLHHVGKVGEIQELFVRMDYRNQRIGHKLITVLDALALQEGFINLEVTTNQKRSDTVRFYEREAFRRTHFKLVKPISF